MNEEQEKAVAELRRTVSLRLPAVSRKNFRDVLLDASESVITLLDQAQRERDEFERKMFMRFEEVREIAAKCAETEKCFDIYKIGAQAAHEHMIKELGDLEAKCAKLEAALRYYAENTGPHFGSVAREALKPEK